MSRRREAVHLRPNNRLIRRASIRRILMGRYHSNGISSIEHLQSELLHATGIRASRETLNTDLKDLGATKVTDAETGISWWVVPAFNPNVEDIRDQLDPDQVEYELGAKLAAHAVDVTPIGNTVYIMTEPRAGLLVGYWARWLAWPEILVAREFLDHAEIVCFTPDAALSVAEKLVGWGVPQGVGDESEAEGEG